MTDTFTLATDWLDAAEDDPAETATLAQISVAANGTNLSAISDSTGAVSSGARLPAIQLAEGLIRKWWQLLFEPQRTQDRDPRSNFEIRHRLDSLTAGYVFPPIGIWSGGETVIVGLFQPDTRFQVEKFLLPNDFRLASIPRGEITNALGAFVESTLKRLNGLNSRRSSDLREDWDRIIASTHDPEELEWCTNSGRLGLDSYDPDTPDLARFAAGIDRALFSDICEAEDVSEIFQTCEWVRHAILRSRNSKPISVREFLAPPYRDLSAPGWRNGQEAAELLRSRLARIIHER